MPGASILGLRDTDADWRELGATQPYWGVLTADIFRTENLTPENVEAFYDTGGVYIAEVVAGLERATGARPSGRALDFGCGVGRLSEAMAGIVGEVVGFDISPGMLALALGRKGRATYVGEMPDGPFDWINSFIVFQHIEPPRGLAILEQLLARLAPGGMVSLHFTVWREAALEQPTFTGLRARAAALRHRLWLKNLPAGQILMYDYDLSQIVRLMNRAGIEEARLVSTDHGGHHGVIIFGRKAAQQTPA